VSEDPGEYTTERRFSRGLVPYPGWAFARTYHLVEGGDARTFWILKVVGDAAQEVWMVCRSGVEAAMC
jgi:hypothetical protein